MNQAVQQKKVATIVSQLQNTGSAPNLATTMVASLHHKNDSKSDRDKETETPELSTFDDVSYIDGQISFPCTGSFFFTYYNSPYACTYLGILMLTVPTSLHEEIF